MIHVVNYYCPVIELIFIYAIYVNTLLDGNIQQGETAADEVTYQIGER